MWRVVDGTQFWAWNDNTAKWQPLANDYSKDINKAFAIAEKKAAPSLLTLPVSVNVETN
ncbi:TonB system biopolymer transport component [Photobacterium aphoticum]|uniref:TonB system biopolymer transport component n=1 Tax=Photobacterium aphoticum TaxID=754436 RepID=A0A090QJC3_9GAMM|nr:TonB system biopolymer transport component [Photobacterium aphoticum]